MNSKQIVDLCPQTCGAVLYFLLFHFVSLKHVPIQVLAPKVTQIFGEFADPRWGRGSETFGEDPWLTSKMTAAYVSGMQGNNTSSYIKTISVCKHFLGYSLEEVDGVSRFWFDADISAQDLADTYTPAWKACVEAGARGLMCS